MKTIFFLIIIGLASSGLFTFQSVYANHLLTFDDVWYWREHDNDNINSVWCTFDSIIPFGDSIGLQCEGGVFSGTTRTGAMYIMKVFNKAEIRNGSSTNVFSWHFENTCTEATCASVNVVVMDGAYTYNQLTEPGGFPANSDYNQANSVTCAAALGNWEDAGTNLYCLGNTAVDLNNIFGAGDLDIAGNTIPHFGTSVSSLTTKGTVTINVSITNAEWNESTESQITVFLFVNKRVGVTNNYVIPIDFQITNTPDGTVVWNFPETVPEANNWASFLGYVYEQNGTESDHGYFFSYDPSVPDPPTNLSAVADTNDIDLFWDAPLFVGFDPIIGYKVERESPVGGGFGVIVANTGSTNEFYSDTTITPGVEYNYRVSALNSIGSSIPSNESVDGSPPVSVPDVTPDYSCPSTISSFELFIKAITSSSIGLCWDNFANPENISGYQINYTSPWGDPLTVILNDTGTNGTRTYLITSLHPSTQYSFQIQAWPKTLANQTNIANATTLTNEFNVGEFTVNAGTNPYTLPFEFSKTILNTTQTQLDVTFKNTLDPSCNMEYRFANVNQTYSNLTSSIVDDDRNMTSFIFNDVQNEIIKVKCYDGDDEATYIITQEAYPLLQQIQNFRNGTYGTSGQFGAFDLITLVAIILSMIGFNRVNAGAGAIFTVIMIGALATLNIITWPVIILSAVALFVLLAVITHSRDDVSE